MTEKYPEFIKDLRVREANLCGMRNPNAKSVFILNSAKKNENIFTNRKQYPRHGLLCLKQNCNIVNVYRKVRRPEKSF